MNMIFLYVVAAFASGATYYASHSLGWGPVKASAVLSSAAVILTLIIFHADQHNYLAINIPLVFFGASFAGMSSKKVLCNTFYAILSGLIFCLIYLGTATLFKGYGGGLGARACLAVVLALGLDYLIELSFAVVRQKH
jgi:hypothetical protein